MEYKRIELDKVKENAARMFSEGWAILTAGDSESFNSMTVSWGALGELWRRDVAFCFVRPQRYTYEFCERSDMFTLSFYDVSQHRELSVFGSSSGRDTDKFAQTGFSPIPYNNTCFVNNSRLVLICKKIAYQDLQPKGFVDASIDGEIYPEKDYHRMYIGQIVDVLVRVD